MGFGAIANDAIISDRKYRRAGFVSAPKRAYSSAAYSLSFIDVLAPLLLSVGGYHRNCARQWFDIGGDLKGPTAAVSKVTSREAILEITLYSKDKNGLCITTSDDNDSDATTRRMRECAVWRSRVAQIEIDRSKFSATANKRVRNSRREVVETSNPASFNRLLAAAAGCYYCSCARHRCHLGSVGELSRVGEQWQIVGSLLPFTRVMWVPRNLRKYERDHLRGVNRRRN